VPTAVTISAVEPSPELHSVEELPARRVGSLLTLSLRSIPPIHLKCRADLDRSTAGTPVGDHEQAVCAWSIREAHGSETRFRHWVKRLSSVAGFDLTRYSSLDERCVGPEIRLGELDGLTSFAVERAAGALLAMVVRPIGAGRSRAGAAIDGIPIGVERLQVALRQTPARASSPAGVEVALLISRRALPGLLLGLPDLPSWLAGASTMPARASDVDAALSIWMGARGAIASSVQDRLSREARPANATPMASRGTSVAAQALPVVAPQIAAAPTVAAPANTGGDKTVAIFESLLEAQDREMQAGKAEVVGARAEIHRLRGLIDTLGNEVVSLRARLASQRPIFSSWDDVWEFARAAMVGQIAIAPRAIVAASKSSYRNYPFAADVLSLLANEYRDMRLGGEQARARCEARREALRVRISHVGAALDNPRHRDRYTAVHAGRRYVLDHHVCGSSSRDRARGFRCYFHWDEDSRVVLIGALPDHLENSLS